MYSKITNICFNNSNIYSISIINYLLVIYICVIYIISYLK